MNLASDQNVSRSDSATPPILVVQATHNAEKMMIIFLLTLYLQLAAPWPDLALQCQVTGTESRRGHSKVLTVCNIPHNKGIL